MNVHSRHLIVLVAIALVALVCGVPVFANGSVEQAAAAGKHTVVVWDQFFPQAQNNLMNSFVADYQAAHPDVTIQRTPYDTDSLRTVLRPALNSGKGPDIFYYDAGPAFLGELVDAGLVYDLSAAYKQKGWDQSLVKWTVERVTYHGKIWGVPNEIEYTNVWFNKDIIQAIGMSDKIVKYSKDGMILTLSNFDDFLTMLQKAKDAGYVPTVLGNRDPGRAGHWFSYLVAATAGKEKIDNILFGNGRWDSPEVVKAIQVFKQISDKGLFNDSPNAVSFDEANALFFGGRAATNLTGTWLVSDVLTNVPDSTKISFFLLPSVDGGKAPTAGAGIGSTFAVAKATKDAQAAVDFLDYLMSKESGVRWLQEGSVIPPINGIDVAKLNLPELTKMAIAGSSLPLCYNLDVVMPEQWNAAMKNGLSAVINGTKTPEQLAADLQKGWEAGKAEGKIWKAR